MSHERNPGNPISCFPDLTGWSQIPIIKGDSRDPQQWDPLTGSFPYYSHTTPIRIPKDMGMVWEAYHKGGPIVGGPWKIPLHKDSYFVDGGRIPYPRSSTVRPLKMIVGRRSFPFGMVYFQGRIVKLPGGNYKKNHFLGNLL